MTQELAEEKNRATFDTDMVITNVTRVEADEERELPEKVIVKGCVFDFRKSLLPVEFSVYAPYAPEKALDYFENLGATPSTPVFTRVQGVQVSKTIIRKVEEESAFGDAKVREVRNSQRDFVINWAQPETYEWDSEDTILASELNEIKGEQKAIEWGSQIRSYVLHPYSMVKDNRSGYESNNPKAILDGDLDECIYAYLKSMVKEDD